MITNKKERLTNQKKAILDYLKSVKTHPSAEEIYQKVKKKLPRISRGTVYRILNSLKEKGRLQEITSQVSHFDGDISSHAHFVCQKCDRIFDIFDVCKECKVVRRKKIKIGKIKSWNLIFYGICQNCQNKK